MKYNILILGFILMVSIPLIIFPTTVKAEVCVYCEESSYTIIGRNENVTIPIKISGVEDLRAFSISIGYNTNYLTADPSDLTEADFLSNSGDPTQWYVAGTDGNYTATCAILGVTDGSSGAGTLFTINLMGLSQTTTGGTIISLSSVILMNVMNDSITVDVIDGSTVNVEFPVYADIKLFLEGPYDIENHCMKTTLHNSIPLTSPYPDAISVASIPDNVVDWVFVELLSSLTGSALDSKSMFLKSDGQVLDPLFSSPGFLNTAPGSYYVLIKHRNHLEIISKTTHEFKDEGAALQINLTAAANVYGTDGIKELETGICGMYCGDTNQDDEITTMDYTRWYNSYFLGATGYKSSDINLDGEVTTMDYTKWYNNYFLGAHSCVPEL